MKSKIEQLKATNDDIQARLEKIFCPPLDSSLIAAIWNDTHDFEASVSTLNQLVAEANAGLDAEQSLHFSECSSPYITASTASTSDCADPPGTLSLTESVEFLKSCFVTNENLEKVLREQDGDVAMAVDVLLNEVFLDSEFVESNPITTSSSGSSVESIEDKYRDLVLEYGIEKGKKRRNRRVKKQIMAMNYTASDFVDEISYDPGEDNRWVRGQEDVLQLANRFSHVPHRTIASTYHANQGDFTKTFEALWVKYGQPRGTNANTGVDDKELSTLMEMFPEWPVEKLKMILDSCDGNLDKAVDRVIKALSGPSASQSYTAHLNGLEPSLKLTNIGYSPHMEQLSDQRGLDKTDETRVSNFYLFPATLDEEVTDDPIQCRLKAFEFIEKRNDAFRKAARAYQKAKGKGAGQGGVALYYSGEGREYDAQVKEWNRRAARAIIKKHRQEAQDNNLLDLHGLTVSEAVAVVRDGVNQWYTNSITRLAREPMRDLRIVSGVGNHSPDRVARIYPAVVRMLLREKWRIDISNQGVILVKGAARP
ncbi:uncharacterized protein VTP21DRAFT_1071 [Calcarisporiella thermophila]|uniref:uncharacterized protein n=1 Tax=Calcarisporiella thermophila TaxID=911321 RepID=UPI003742E51E